MEGVTTDHDTSTKQKEIDEELYDQIDEIKTSVYMEIGPVKAVNGGHYQNSSTCIYDDIVLKTRV